VVQTVRSRWVLLGPWWPSRRRIGDQVYTRTGHPVEIGSASVEAGIANTIRESDRHAGIEGNEDDLIPRDSKIGLDLNS